MSPKIVFACSKGVRQNPLTVSIHVLGRNFLSNWTSLMKDVTKDKTMDFITLSHGTSLTMCHEEQWRSVARACENGSNSEKA